jgi:hypothetical protein
LKNKLIGILVCMLLIIPALSMSAAADPEAKLDIQIFGGFPLPILIQNAGGVITNIGNNTAYNISYTLSIIGGTSGNINITYEGYYEYLEPLSEGGKALGVMTPNANGFGLVTITLTASATNAENVTETAKGFQLGYITWVPMSWLGLIFPFLIP